VNRFSLRERGRALSTVALCIAVLAAFAYEVSVFARFGEAAGQAFVERYGFRPSAALGGEYYRFLSHIFVHGGPAHVSTNVAVLYLTGKPLERRIGSLRFTLLFLLTGVAGATASLLTLPSDGLAVGASGAAMGVAAAATFLVPTNSMLEQVPVLERFSLPVVRSLFSVTLLGSLFIFQETILTFLEFYSLISDSVGHAAHFGGIVVGGLAAFLFDPDDSWRAAKLSAAVTVLGLGVVFLEPFTRLWYGAAALLVLLLVLAGPRI
jgi:membrane associated rhomboid family serine protease